MPTEIKNFILVVFLLVISLAGKSQRNVPLQWLTGTWKIQTTKGPIIEEWKQADDSTFVGRSILIQNAKDTLILEKISLAFRNGEWFYIPQVTDQNNNQPVHFKVIFLKGTEFIAENPAHDFPQRINYRRIANTMFASVEGRNQGKYNKQNFDYQLQ